MLLNLVVISKNFPSYSWEYFSILIDYMENPLMIQYPFWYTISLYHILINFYRNFYRFILKNFYNIHYNIFYSYKLYIKHFNTST